MKTITFHTRLEAVEWIASNVDNEGQFEVLREQLNFNEIYTGRLFLKMAEELPEVVLLESKRNP